MKNLCPDSIRALASAGISMAGATTAWVAWLDKIQHCLGLAATAVAITAGVYSIRASRWAIRANKAKVGNSEK